MGKVEEGGAAFICNAGTRYVAHVRTSVRDVLQFYAMIMLQCTGVRHNQVGSLSSKMLAVMYMPGRISATSAYPGAMTTFVTMKAAAFNYVLAAFGAVKYAFLRDARSTSLVTAVSKLLLYRRVACNKKKRTKWTKPLLTFLMKIWTKVKS